MTDNDTNQPATADQDWFGGRRWTGIAAIGFIILIALCALVVVIINHGGGHQSATPTPAAPASTSPRTAASSAGSPLPTTPPIVAPAGTQWTIYQTVALPSIAGSGPTKVVGPVATGYAHSPLGALLAVTNEGYRYILATDSDWKTASAAMLAPGVGTTAWNVLRRKNPYGAGGAAGQDQLAQIAGFQFVSYTPTDAVVQIVTRDSKGDLQVGADHVVWNAGDWKYVPAANGGQEANVQQIESLSGFIAWKGV